VTVATLLALFTLTAQASAAQISPAQLRIVHASPDAPNVDLFVDGKLVLSNLAYGAVSDHLSVAPGKHTLQIAPAGAGRDEALINRQVDLIRGRSYTVVALNQLAFIEALVLQDETSGLQPGAARLRVIHASYNAPPVDIKPANSNIPLLTDQYFKSADFLDIDSGTYTFEVAPAGSDDVFLITPPLQLERGWSYTLLITGIYGANPSAITFVDRVAP